MIGHECTLTRANSGGVIWLCQCGAIGDVVPMVNADKEITARSRRRLELTEDIARGRHAEHLRKVEADVIALSERRLAALGSDIKAANKTLQRRGRWGRP